MNTKQKLALALLCPFLAQPAFSQGLMEGMGVRGLSAGLGAGTAASMNKGKFARRTYETAIQAQQAVLAQTKQIQDFLAQGTQCFAKKQWENAEKFYQSALQMIAKRDGPGSPHSAPVLEKLATVSKEQKKIDQAISYQKTVVAFANASRVPNGPNIVRTQNELTNLYVAKGDFARAEPIAKSSVDLARTDKSVSPREVHASLRVYGIVLRGLNKEAEAQAVEASIAAEPNATAVPGTPLTAGSTPPYASNPTSVTTPDVTAQPPVSATSAAEPAPSTAAQPASSTATTEAQATQPAPVQQPISSEIPVGQEPPSSLPSYASSSQSTSQPSASTPQQPGSAEPTAVAPSAETPAATSAASQPASTTPETSNAAPVDAGTPSNNITRTDQSTVVTDRKAGGDSTTSEK